jgi:hypothetical protein
VARQPILDLHSRVHGYELLFWTGRKPLGGAGSDLAIRTVLDNTGALLRIDTGYVRTYTVFMNITLSIDEQIAERAREKLRAVGKSLNQEIREHLAHLAGDDDVERDLEFLERTSGLGRPDANWKWNREDAYEERLRWPRS